MKLNLRATFLALITWSLFGSALQSAPVPVTNADKLAALRKEHLAAAKKAFDTIWASYHRGHHDEETVYQWSLRLLEAQKRQATTKAQRIAALGEHLERMTKLKKEAPERRIAIIKPDAVRLGAGGFGGAAKPPPMPRIFEVLIDKDGKSAGLRRWNPRPKEATILAEHYRVEAALWLLEEKVK